MLYGENYRVSCLSHQFLFIHVSLVPTTFSERLSFRDTRSFLDAESSSSFSVLLLFVLSVAWTCRSFSFWKCFDFSASLKPLFLVHFQPIFFSSCFWVSFMAGVSWTARSGAESSEGWAGSACDPRRKSKTTHVNTVKTQKPRKSCGRSSKGEQVLEKGSGAREQPKRTVDKNTGTYS